MKVGVLGLQGAVTEHLDMLSYIENVEPVEVKAKEDFDNLSGLIIPGGESTTIRRLIRNFDLREMIINIAKCGKPIMGTCAGMVVLAKETDSDIQYGESTLGLMDIKVKRNGFGRQVDSFETSLIINGISRSPFEAVFIRAPYVMDHGSSVKKLAVIEDKNENVQEKIVGVQQENLLAFSFHPELTSDIRIHEYFVSLIK